MARKRSDAAARQHAIDLYTTRIADWGGSQVDARRYVGQMLGVSEATVRRWVTTRAALAALNAPAAVADRDAAHAAAHLARAHQRRAIELLIAASADFCVADFYAARSDETDSPAVCT